MRKIRKHKILLKAVLALFLIALYIGHSYFHSGNYDKAILAYERAISLNK